MIKHLLPIAIILGTAACTNPDKPSDPEIDNPPIITMNAPKTLQSKFIAEYPHDISSFTEGLQLVNGKLYEGTGDWQNSALKIVDIATGKVQQSHFIGTSAGPNEDGIFGEGITVLKDKIYQLTWRNHKAYVYDVKDITKSIKEVYWPYEGWGMTTDGTQLIISDGQDAGNIYFVNPDDFKITKTIQVKTDNGAVKYVNELEFIDGFLYANIWQTDYIIKIDPTSGNVVGSLNVKTLLPQFYSSYIIKDGDNVLNGIAFDAAKKEMLITGKRWPKLFAISLPE